MVAWTNISVASGFTLPSSTMTAMFENFQAISSGYSGAPKIQSAAITSGALGWQSLKTGVGTISIATSGGSPSTLDIQLESHCFLPSFRGISLGRVAICPVFSAGFTAASADLPILRMREVSGTVAKPGTYIAYRYLIP